MVRELSGSCEQKSAFTAFSTQYVISLTCFCHVIPPCVLVMSTRSHHVYSPHDLVTCIYHTCVLTT